MALPVKWPYIGLSVEVGAYEDIATAGRAVAKGRTGRPTKYEFTEAEWEIIGGIWTSRKFANDGARLAAILRSGLARCRAEHYLETNSDRPTKGASKDRSRN